MMKLAPEWVRTSDPVIRSPARYRWTTAPPPYARREQLRCKSRVLLVNARLLVFVCN